MRIVVLGGSPKGEESVTLQFIYYIQKEYPQHQFEFYNVCQRINEIENNQNLFREIMNSIKEAEGVLWAFPVIFFLVHSNYKRFIELIRERNAEAFFKDKYTAALSTSIHIFDNTAHEYIHAVCDDLDMKYVGFFSASKDDLLQKSGRKNLNAYIEDFLDAISAKSYNKNTYRPNSHPSLKYAPGDILEKVDSKNKRILMITDCPEQNSNLGRMIERMRNSFTDPVEVIDLNKINIKGGCLCCFHCGFDNECVYGDNDDIKDLYNNKIKQADIIIFAARIVDRFFSSRWKMFIDRRFINTHQPQMINKQVCYIISGPLSQNYTIKQIIKAQVEVDQANLAGIVTDEYSDSEKIDTLLDVLAKKLVHYSEHTYVRPFTFIGNGTRKILRDLIWGKERIIFSGDYRFYKKHNMFDYPQKNIGMRITNLFLIGITTISFVKRKIQKNTKSIMISSLQKVLSAESKKL